MSPISKKRPAPKKHPKAPARNQIPTQQLTEVVDNQRYAPEQAGKYLGVSPDTLSIWRCRKRYGLPFYKMGRLVQYLGRDLREFVESRRIAS